MVVYKAYIDGFSSPILNSVEAVQSWYNSVKAKNTFKNVSLKIWKGEGSESCAVFSAEPYKVLAF